MALQPHTARMALQPHTARMALQPHAVRMELQPHAGRTALQPHPPSVPLLHVNTRRTRVCRRESGSQRLVLINTTGTRSTNNVFLSQGSSRFDSPFVFKQRRVGLKPSQSGSGPHWTRQTLHSQRRRIEQGPLILYEFVGPVIHWRRQSVALLVLLVPAPLTERCVAKITRFRDSRSSDLVLFHTDAVSGATARTLLPSVAVLYAQSCLTTRIFVVQSHNS